MRIRHIAALVTAVACLSLTACEDTTKSAPAATKTVTEAPTVDAADDDKPAAGDPAIAVPDFVGMGLQEAQDAAQAAGFFLLTSHDNTGAGRMQILDRNWQVCDQNPAAGETIPASTELDFGTVKLEESCP